MFTVLLIGLLAPVLAPAGEFSGKILAADRSTGKLAVVDASGKVFREFANKHDVHDLQVLSNGNILTHTSPTTVVEISPANEIVWKYESKPVAGKAGRVEVHAFQRLADGNTMIAESGNCRIIEVDAAGKIVKEMALALPKPDAHRDTRMVRKLKNGNYLVCHESIGTVREYDETGKIVWFYTLDLGGRPRSGGHGVEGHGTEVYGAIRLDNGNTLIGGGNNNRVLEVNPAKEVVWSIDQKELPGITLAWVTTVAVLKDDTIVIGNCHAGPKNPQLIAVTRDKKVVWTWTDFKNFGDNTATAVVWDRE